jgi:molybdopterin-guanine dinucleotide biosynthesis protein A
MTRHPQIAAFILAGGVSSRMGREKSLLEIAGEPLLVRTARTIDPLVSDVTIVGLPERYAATGLRALADRTVTGSGESEPARTPLVGIVTALQATRSPWNLILACDLPHLTADWVDWLLARALASRAQIVVPRSLRGLEPLAAVYRRECAEPLLGALERGVRKVTDALAELPMEQIPESDWKEFDAHGRVLRNMNTPQDYDEAKKILE